MHSIHARQTGRNNEGPLGDASETLARSIVNRRPSTFQSAIGSGIRHIPGQLATPRSWVLVMAHVAVVPRTFQGPWTSLFVHPLQTAKSF